MWSFHQLLSFSFVSFSSLSSSLRPFCVAHVLRFPPRKEQRTAQSKDSTMKMKTLRFARECVYIYLLKRRPDANKCILHSENTNAQKERESVREINPFLCEYSSLNVRHTFDTFSRENVRERQKSEQTKLRGKAEHTEDAPENEVETLATGGRLLRTRYIMSTPQFRAGNPLAPEKGAFPLDHFGECATFKETYLKCLQVRLICSRARCVRAMVSRSHSY